jgi:NADH:ubiquinone oxidoreductase subunit 6 (subunit J)
MEKQKQQNLIKRYVFFFAFCVGILLIGVVFSIPMKVEVHSIGEKPPFLFALFFSFLLLACAIGAIYLS